MCNKETRTGELIFVNDLTDNITSNFGCHIKIHTHSLSAFNVEVKASYMFYSLDVAENRF